MHIIKNQRGCEVIYQSTSLKSCWGFIDENNDYITMREEKRGQIFHFFQNALALQLELLEYLERKKCNKIRIRIPDYEKEPFWAEIEVKNFRLFAMQWEKETGKKAIFNYDKQDYKKYGKQIRLPINYFTRIYDTQLSIKNYIL